MIRHGRVRKFRRRVAQVTFSGREALRTGQEVMYVTERAVFRLSKDGLVLEEVAPGIDLQSDVLDRMGFAPALRGTPASVPSEVFRDREVREA